MRELPSLYDLITEPNEAALDAQAELFGRNGVLHGKFIRLGQIVLLAPETEVDRLPGMRTHDIEHIHIIQASLRHPNSEFATRVRAANGAARDAAEQNMPEAEPLLDFNYGMVDAGRFEFLSLEKALSFSFKSYKFGQADDAGRRETVRLAQEAIGSNVTVSQGV